VVLFAGAEQDQPEQPPPPYIPGTTLLFLDNPLRFADVWEAQADSGEDPSTMPNPTESTAPNPRR